ncbi:sugar transferase [Sphingomonas sp. SUN019]|uniref:sugar transferase n=1 Tax=Sphingomonas sp. SUN019 TaxID=2937788 RepID=UPI00216409EC|nr:sugar transferase [Sphingomonas sp. SUN019]UVO51682.1 sugar transferase [Sphingomonas sp. SUN019]
MKIVVLASLAYSLVNFRGALLARMVAEGHEVVACAPDPAPPEAAALAKIGVRYVAVAMDRTGANPLQDLATLRRLVRLLRAERPDVLLAYTQKPIVYGGLASRIVGGIRFFAMVSGLGHVFSDGGGARRRALRVVLSRMYRAAVARAERIFVFNRDDASEMRALGIVDAQPVDQLPGSGVDVHRFAHAPLPPGPLTFLMVARLMRDKGLAEFVAAARAIRARHPAVRFQILGPLDPNPTGITRADIDRWARSGDVEYLGETRDVAPMLARASVFVLPSYYREGLPRTILEAMATGRAIVTTNMPGCREPITEGTNGLLVPPRDADALAAAMQCFVDDPALAASMGAASRTIAEDVYDVDKVNDRIIAAMGLQRGAPSAAVATRRALGDRPAIELPLAMVAMLLAMPVMALVALVVFATLGRPVMFAQTRAGRDGIPFTLRKFRTMRDSVDAAGDPLPDAERLTPTGRVLRRARLDELPGLWNVLRRDMSLIGPRPLLPPTIQAMGSKGVARGAVRPGMTGWAQVNGNALLGDGDKVALDLWYIAHRSLSLDARIVARTLWVVVGGETVRSHQIERAYARTADRRG